MQRFKLNMRGGTYTQGNIYNVQPVYRQQVVPGQTVDLNAEVSIKSAALTKNVSTPALASMWFFYVPHRLVWEDWPAFISKEDGAPAFPATTIEDQSFFESVASTGQQLSPLYRRAYKLVYNEYFGNETISDAWYSDITDDTSNALKGAKNPEQFASKIINSGAVVDPEFTVVSSAIPLNEFYRSMMNARSQQRSQMTGNKYVDTLARMGVDATWMITERPEFLGTKSQLVAPQLTANTGTDLGQEAARFQAKLMCQINRKQFAEHGYIVGVACLRPLLTWSQRSAQDAMAPDNDWINSFYSADNTLTKDEVVPNANGFTSGTAYTQRFGYLKNGAWIRGKGSSWNIGTPSPTDFSQVQYPASIDFPISDELGTDEVAYTSSVNAKGLIPVGNHVA